eukprot:9472814-Pyramimonas_sp.AAC.1
MGKCTVEVSGGLRSGTTQRFLSHYWLRSSVVVVDGDWGSKLKIFGIPVWDGLGSLAGSCTISPGGHSSQDYRET